MYKLLLIDDDTEVLEINQKYLERQNYEVAIASNAIDGLKLISEFMPDCIVLDVMMPNVNGFSACKKYRTLTTAPIIFLTGCISEDNKIKGFELGADDYLEKPYSLRELTARIQANLRRSTAYSTPTTLIFGPLSIDIAAHKAFYEEEELPLSNREFDLLKLLADHSNETLTFQEIGFEMFGSYSDNDRRSVMVNMSRLRKKLENYAGLSEMIETVWSKGYKFITR